MKKKILFGISFLCLGLLVGLVLAGKANFSSQAISQTAPAKSEAIKTTDASGLEGAIINVARNTGPAVVSISTEHVTKIKGGKKLYFGSPYGQSPFGEDDFLRRYFEDFFNTIPENEFRQRGLGSGVIIDQKGYILTNEHVIADADKISVTLPDGREFKAEVKGRDSRSDLAVIKIDATALPVAQLGNSDAIKIGQWVAAIGNPFGYALQNPEPTVTVGVVSALHRSLGNTISLDKDYSDLIQTDAAINPGNSGGPLVNLNGQVVGINVAIFSTSGGYQGLGFAIPVNSAKRIISRLIEGKKVVYGWLGVTIQDMTDDLAKYFGLADKNGVLCVKVMADSPAQKAGMKESDVIKQVDGNKVNNVRELLNIVAKAEPGKKMKLTVLRDKKELVVDVVVGERPENIEEESIKGQEASVKSWRGIGVEELNEQNRRLSAPGAKSGVIITDIEPGSPADEARLMPGDVIIELNKQPVSNMADYEKGTKAAKGNILVKTARGYFLVKGEEK